MLSTNSSSPQEARANVGVVTQGHWSSLSLPPPAPSPQWLWRRGSVHFNLLAFWTPPQTTHTWYPHTHTNLHFKENSLHMFPIHLHFNSLWGGAQSAERLASKRPPSCPRREAGEHVSKETHIFQGCGAVKAGPPLPNHEPSPYCVSFYGAGVGVGRFRWSHPVISTVGWRSARPFL